MIVLQFVTFCCDKARGKDIFWDPKIDRSIHDTLKTASGVKTSKMNPKIYKKRVKALNPDISCTADEILSFQREVSFPLLFLMNRSDQLLGSSCFGDSISHFSCLGLQSEQLSPIRSRLRNIQANLVGASWVGILKNNPLICSQPEQRLGVVAWVEKCFLSSFSAFPHFYVLSVLCELYTFIFCVGVGNKKMTAQHLTTNDCLIVRVETCLVAKLGCLKISVVAVSANCKDN